MSFYAALSIHLSVTLVYLIIQLF